MKPLSIFFCLVCLSETARAHAFLDHAEPKVGSSIDGSPTVVKIWFTEELEPAFSRIRVYAADKAEVDRHDVKVDPDERTLMIVSVPRLVAGSYMVKWDAVAIDTHHTSGTFTFQVTGS